MSFEPLDKGYEPHDVEKRWYDFWEKNRMFAASTDDGRPPYSIVIPPPNVTGVLHMGHALNITLQDILCRYRRLKGDSVLWMPGTDHAGIATQNVVEKKLAAEGTSRHALGREKFIETVWAWRRESGGAIINQLKRLGACCDWDRERFTMDDGLSAAVRKVFVQLYDEGLIYRGNYIINWCPRCHTALADLEVDHEDHDGHLYHILYPFPGEKDGIIVATTRPETMLGDTALAVNPEDERYSGMTRTSVILPLMEREIPIIRDSYVDMSFGTGGLKVTPAHDPNDFEIGQRHNLDSVKVIGDDGTMTDAAGRFAGLDRFAAREAVVAALEEEGLLKKLEPHAHSVGHCYRCKTVIEPNLSRQWFVSAKPLAEKAIAAVKSGNTRIVPDAWAKTYFDWMENIRDWCVSRQIWWGHQIPAWTCTACGEVVVSTETPAACPACGGALTQETDVLDTWFSSALWPFSTMGWPEQTDLLDKFYPTSVLVTGFDILFFWVARMMMMGIHFMGDVPFKEVYVHALVRDEDGKKMSKSKGNVIDPLTVIDTYGTDAFRFTLAAFAAQGRDIKMSEKRVEGYRHFINKIWNAARFCLMHLDEAGHEGMDPEGLSLFDRWILSRLSRVTAEVADALDGYRFNEAAGTLYQFVWHEFCDWYLEVVKPTLYGEAGEAGKKEAAAVLSHVLSRSLVLLHPFIPFVTEEIWHKLPGSRGSIMDAAFPGDGEGGPLFRTDAGAEADAAFITGVITGIRNIRGEMNIPPALSLSVSIHCPDKGRRDLLAGQQHVIRNLARLEGMDVQAGGSRPRSAASVIIEDTTVFVALEGIVDFKKEALRLDKEIAKLAAEQAQIAKKLSNADFLGKAPAHVVSGVKEKAASLAEKHEKLSASLEKIKSLDAG